MSGIEVRTQDGKACLQLASPDGDEMSVAMPPELAYAVAANLLSAADSLVGSSLGPEECVGDETMAYWDYWRQHMKQRRPDLYEEFDEAEGDFLGWRYQDDHRVVTPEEFAGYRKRCGS